MALPLFSRPLFVAIFAVTLSTVVRLALDPLLHTKAPLLVFACGVVAAALYGRLRAGIFATLLSLPAADFFFIEPRHAWGAADVPGELSAMILYLALGVLISIVIESFHRVRDRLRQAAHELQQTEARLQSLADTVPEILFVVLADGSYDYLSQRFYDYSGVNPLRARSDLIDVIHPEDRHIVQEQWNAALQPGAEYGAMFRLRGRDGTYRWFKAHAKPIRNPDGRIVKWSGVCSDIHEQKTLQDAVMAANEEFQSFAYRVSHDLKEPLRTIGLYSEMLVRRHPQEEDKESRLFTAYIVNGIDRVESQMRSLIEYSRAGSLAVTHELIDFNIVLDSAVANLHAAIRETGATITRDPMPHLVANEDRIRSVFQNLVGNALKYRSSRPPRVHVSARAEPAEWIFVVEDNGIGFDMKDADRIFGAFERVSSSREVQGSGLGLAIVKRIVETKGGRIWAESEIGRGSRFFVALPRTLEKFGPKPQSGLSRRAQA